MRNFEVLFDRELDPLLLLVLLLVLILISA